MEEKTVKMRVDMALVQRGLAPSRERAQALIMAGQVYIAEKKVLKASEQVEEKDAQETYALMAEMRGAPRTVDKL